MSKTKKRTKRKGMDGKACWKGYTLRGTKKKGQMLNTKNQTAKCELNILKKLKKF